VAKENNMELCFLTKAQKEKFEDTRHEYTDDDVLELSCLSNSISALVHCMIVYHLNKDGREDDQDIDVPVYSILEQLIKPINTFLFDGAPMQEKEEKNNDSD
jgi:hypothetical protein